MTNDKVIAMYVGLAIGIILACLFGPIYVVT